VRTFHAELQGAVEEILFLLSDVFPIQRYNNLPGFAEATPDLIEAILSEAAKLCEETLLPLNQPGDRTGCIRNKDGSVATPRGFKEAYRAFVAGGWVGLSADPIWAARGCLTRSPRSSMNSRVPRIWLSQCIRA